MVVSPPSVPDLNSLLTGHIGRDRRLQGADDAAAMETVEDPADDNVKSPKKRNKKVKLTKEDKSLKRNPSGLSLKKISFGMPAWQQNPPRRTTNLSGCSTKQGSSSRVMTNTVPMSCTSEIYLKTFNWLTHLQLCMQSASPGVQSLLAPSWK